MLDCAFFLPRLQFEIDAAVMMLAEFGMKLRDQLAERFSVPRHHFGQQQRHHRCIALGQIQFGADPPGFFAAQQDVALEHQLADIFEADGRLKHLTAEFGGDLVDHLGR